MPHVHICEECQKITPTTPNCPNSEDHSHLCDDCFYAEFGDAGILATYALDTEWRGVYIPEQMNFLTFTNRLEQLLTLLREADMAGAVDFPVPIYDLLFHDNVAVLKQAFETKIPHGPPNAGHLRERFHRAVFDGTVLPPSSPPQHLGITKISPTFGGFLYIVDERCDFFVAAMVFPDTGAHLGLETRVINPDAYLTNFRLQEPTN